MRPETVAETQLEDRKVNREVRKTMQAAREECTEEQCKNIKKGMMSENTKEAYDTQQHKSAVIEDSSGDILAESAAVLDQWTD